MNQKQWQDFQWFAIDLNFFWLYVIKVDIQSWKRNIITLLLQIVNIFYALNIYPSKAHEVSINV